MRSAEDVNISVPSCGSDVWLSVASVVLLKVHRSHYRASACHNRRSMLKTFSHIISSTSAK